VLVLGGTNDILHGKSSAFEILGQLRKLHALAGCAPHSPRVGVLTLPPTKPLGARVDQTWQDLNNALRQACQRAGGTSAAPDMASSRQFLVDLATLDVSLSSDGVHYTAEGYQQMALRVFAAMKPFLEVLVPQSTPGTARPAG
jgi:lysophospholipase L1-like esterase